MELYQVGKKGMLATGAGGDGGAGRRDSVNSSVL